MLTEKTRKNSLSTVKKSSAKIIILGNPPKTQEPKKEGKHMFPPQNEFNTGYIKARENDPL